MKENKKQKATVTFFVKNADQIEAAIKKVSFHAREAEKAFNKMCALVEKIQIISKSK